MRDGETLICSTGQAGTVIWVAGDAVQLLLRNGEIWTGPVNQCRTPFDAADLEAAPVEVSRPDPKRKKR